MSHFWELRLESVCAASQQLMRRSFTLIVCHVSPGNSASIKQSPVNRRIHPKLSDVRFEQRAGPLPSILGWWHLLCQAGVQSLNYGKVGGNGRKLKTKMPVLQLRRLFAVYVFTKCHTGCFKGFKKEETITSNNVEYKGIKD